MKTNRTHLKGGKAAAISQGQTQPPAPSRDHLYLFWPKGDNGYSICAGAEAMDAIHAAGLTLTDLEPALATLATALRPGYRLDVEYRELIAVKVRTRELAQLTQALGLSPDEAKALGLISGWEGQSVAQFTRRALLASLDGSYDDMQGWAAKLKGYEHSPASTAHARKYHARVKALRPKGGWQV